MFRDTVRLRARDTVMLRDMVRVRVRVRARARWYVQLGRYKPCTGHISHTVCIVNHTLAPYSQIWLTDMMKTLCSLHSRLDTNSACQEKFIERNNIEQRH